MMTFGDSELPRRFGSYVLKQKLASGGMAELYLAETRGPSDFVKPMVIKMVHPRYSEDQRFLSMFTDEAKILSGLSHGNIVPIFDFGKIDGILYLAMEFIDGVDTATLIDTCRVKGLALSIDVALWIGIGVAAGLAHAHAATNAAGKHLGVIHRDVSPHNILTSRSGEVKLCDFGIAISEAREGDTDSGVIKGKLRFFSPEQARGQEIDPRSDIFSLGVVLYELVSGHHPVPSGTDVGVLKALSEDGGYPSLGEAAPWVPAAITAAVDRAMAFDPANRYQSAEDLRKELSRTLYQEYSDFSPQRLGDLVQLVQEANEQHTARNVDSLIRAQLATFASQTRDQSVRRTRQQQRHGTLRRRLFQIAAAAAVAALGAILLFAYQKTADLSARNAADDRAEKGVKPAGNSAKNETPTKLKANLEANRIANLPTKQDAGFTAEKTALPAAEPRREQPRAAGYADLNAWPWAEVVIDGVARGSTPIPQLKLPAGRHKATFSNPELGVLKQQSFVVKPGETTRVIVELRP